MANCYLQLITATNRLLVASISGLSQQTWILIAGSQRFHSSEKLKLQSLQGGKRFCDVCKLNIHYKQRERR